MTIERFINYRMPTTHDADDIIQNVYLSAFIHFSGLKNKSLFKSWLLTIARNECNLWYRRRNKRNEIPLEEAEDVVDESSGGLYDTAELLDLLPAVSREILTMFYIDGKSQNEISSELRIPIGTVKSRLWTAKNILRNIYSKNTDFIYRKGEIKMDYTMGFPKTMPYLKIEKTYKPYFEVFCDEESFIIPKLGNVNSEATYRYPDKKLALVSTYRVTKKAVIHEVEGVQICRDTFNVNANRMYKNEGVWFTQLTDEYIRSLGSLTSYDDDEYPTTIYTFLEEDYDMVVNSGDRIHGTPRIIKENPAIENNDGIQIESYNIKYTMGVYNVTIGERIFETVKVLRVQMNTLISECYYDHNSRLVLMRWYETRESVESNDNYSEAYKEKLYNNMKITVNGKEFIHIEDRISEYAI